MATNVFTTFLLHTRPASSTRSRSTVAHLRPLRQRLQVFCVLLGSLFMATLFNFIIRRSMGEERNLLDKILILTFKVIFFPLIVTKGNVWALAGMIGLAAGLMMLELHPVLTIGSSIFAAFFGLIWVLWAWIRFMGWLHSLVDKS